MKRSEMVEIINAEIIYATEPRQGRVTNCPKTRKFADTILKAIEKAGMLPPAKHVDIASGRILHYHIHDSIEESGTLSEIAEYWNWNLEETDILWEPEDE